MSCSIRTIGASALSILLFIPSQVMAQETGAIAIPSVEVSGGFTMMPDLDLMENYPGGWYFTGAFNTTRWFGLVAEVTGSYRSIDGETSYGVPYSYSWHLYALLGGPRFYAPLKRVVPFAHFLAGTAFVRHNSPDYSDVDHQMALLPGGGITVYVNERVGARLAFDYRLFIDGLGDGEAEMHEGYRALAGVTFGWGTR